MNTAGEPRFSSKRIADMLSWPHSIVRMEVMNAERRGTYETYKHFPQHVPRETIVDEDGEHRDAFLLNAQQVKVVLGLLKGVPGSRKTKKEVLAYVSARVKEARVDHFMEKLAAVEHAEAARLGGPGGAKLLAGPGVEGSVAEMTSLEIAEMTGRRHDKVKYSVEQYARRGIIEFPPEREIQTATKPVKIYVFSGKRGKRDSLVIAAINSPRFVAQIIDRGLALEHRAAPLSADGRVRELVAKLLDEQEFVE